MEQALFHIQAAIDVLRRSAGPQTVLSTLEVAQANLMHDIFGAPLALASLRASGPDWSLGPDEPLPHDGLGRLSAIIIGFGEPTRSP